MRIELSEFADFSLLIKIIEILKRHQIESYFVGGAVRDFYMGVPSKDFDIVYLGISPEELRYLLSNYDIKTGSISQFLTFTCLSEGPQRIDFAHARKEIYPFPGSLPKVSPTNDISLDLRRRDFTINSIAVNIFPASGKLLDPFGGLVDLKKGVIRVVKRNSFFEDPTRAFRAIRYRHRFKFNYSSGIASEWEGARISIKNISFDRIKSEFKKIVHESEPIDIAEEIDMMGLLSSFDERFKFNRTYAEKLKSYNFSSDDDWVVLFALFVTDKASICDLSLTKIERKFFIEVFSILDVDLPSSFLEMHSKCKSFSEKSLTYVALVQGHKGLLEYTKRRRKVSLELDGETLISMGVPRSKVSKYLDELFALRIAGEIKGREDEVKYIKRTLSKK